MGDSNFKWFVIMLIVGIIAISIGVNIRNCIDHKIELKAIDQGLVQCVNKDGYRGDTLWLKECK